LLVLLVAARLENTVLVLVAGARSAILLEDVLEHLERLGWIGVFQLEHFHRLLAARVGVEILNYSLDLVHEVAGGADDHRGCAGIGHGQDPGAFLDALTL